MWQRQARREQRQGYNQAQQNDAINNDLDEHQAGIESVLKEMREGFNKIYWALILSGLAFAGSVAAYVINSILQNG